MCWLLVIFTALLCSQVSDARSRGSGRVADLVTQDHHGTQIQEDSASKILEVSEPQIPDGTGSQIPNGTGSQIPNGTGSQIPDGTGSQTPDGTGSQIQDGTGSQIPDGTRSSQIQKELEEAMKELELAERFALEVNTRESRGFLKKVAFLAGLKVGGLVQSSGTLAASNSFRVFGKVVNSALSVSYGTVDELNEVPEIEGSPVLAERPALEEPGKIAVKVASVEERPLIPNIREAEEQAHRRIKANFLNDHNALVHRANNKYLRISRAQEHN